MNKCFSPIKRKIQILLFSLNLICFIIIILFTNNKKDYIEYTSLSKFFSNLYIIAILLILLIHSISPNLIFPLILENISIITNDNGKIVINLLIGILYWSSNNNAHVIFGIFNFVSSLALFICEFIFHFKIIKYIHFDTESNEDKNSNNNNSKDMKKDYNINNFNLKKQISNDKREEKNGSILPLNEQMPNNDLNGFENLKQKNFEAQSSI